MIAAVSAALAGPSHADRHCAFASESYYAARQDLLDAAPNASRDALANLEDALQEAVICGCPAIIDALTAANRRAQTPGLSAEAVASIVLNARVAVDAALGDCHS